MPQPTPAPTLVRLNAETRSAAQTAALATRAGEGALAPMPEASVAPDTAETATATATATIATTAAPPTVAEPAATAPAEATAAESTVVAGATPPSVEHTVQWGENLTLIARQYGVTVASIVQANSLADPSSIWVGQVLVIPVGDEPAGIAAATPIPPATPADAVTPAPAALAPANQTPLDGRIAFQVASGGDIYLVNADGSDLRRLTAGMDPAWSPDGSLVAFARWTVPWGLYVIGADGSGERLVWQQNLVRAPTWSPDGAALAFTRQEGGQPARRLCAPFGGCLDLPEERYWRLGVVGLDGGGREDPTADLFCLAPFWGADGWIYYAGEGGLKAARLGEASHPVLADLSAASPVLSPDGSRIAFMYDQNGHWDIHLARSDGSAMIALTSSSTLAERPAQNVAPAWSPDGHYILFLSDRDGAWRPYVMAADGSDQSPFLPAVFDTLQFSYEFAAERVFSWR